MLYLADEIDAKNGMNICKSKHLQKTKSSHFDLICLLLLLWLSSMSFVYKFRNDAVECNALAHTHCHLFLCLSLTSKGKCQIRCPPTLFRLATFFSFSFLIKFMLSLTHTRTSLSWSGTNLCGVKKFTIQMGLSNFCPLRIRSNDGDDGDDSEDEERRTRRTSIKIKMKFE